MIKAHQSPTDVCQISNALVAQKNALVDMIDSAASPERLSLASHRLEFVSQLWIALDYGYKVQELADRIASRAYHLISVNDAYIANAGPKGGWRPTVHMARNENVQYQDVIDETRLIGK